jgi:hypothetical protein
MLLLLSGLGVPAVSAAQDEEPATETPAVDEEEQAAKDFAEGRKLYGEGKYKGAIEALLRAYNLRPAPPILLNIARTYEKLGDKKNALKFYKEFLLKARMVDPSRREVEAVVKTLEKEVEGKTGAVTSAAGTEAPTAVTTTEEGPGRLPGGRQQLIHTPVDTARVNQPITVMAELPPGVVADAVVLYFRTARERTFGQVRMETQGEAFVARIPAQYVTTSSLQYYVEAHKGTGKGSVVAQAGSKTTPHIVVIEGGIALPVGPVREEKIRSPYWTWAWVATAGTAALLGAGVAGTVMARDRQSAMETRAHDEKVNCNLDCQEGKGMPKRPFDEQARDWESEGKTFATLGKVFIALGVAAAGGSAYLWYADRAYVKQERRKRAFAEGDRGRFVAAPWAGPQGAGLVGRLDF